MLTKKDFIYITLIAILFYYVFCKRNTKENMSNIEGEELYLSKMDKLLELTKVHITNEVNRIYRSDIEAIRNLSLIATKLQTEESITIPGNLNIKGKLNVDKDANLASNLYVNESGTFGKNSGRKLIIQPSNFNNEQTHLSFYKGNTRTGYILPRIDGQINVKGNVNIQNSAAIQGDLHVFNSLGNVLLKDDDIKVNNIEATAIDVKSTINSDYLNVNNTITGKDLNIKNNGRFCSSSNKPIELSGLDVNNNETSRIEFYNGENRIGELYGNISEKKIKVN